MQKPEAQPEDHNIVGRKPLELAMSKAANSSKIGNSGKDFLGFGGVYREIGIAAVAAAVRCQHMPVPDDERVASRAPAASYPDRAR